MRFSKRPPLTHSLSLTKRAFTLVEIMLVILLLGLIGGVLLTNVTGILGDSQQNLAKLGVEKFDAPLMAHMMKSGKFPSSLSALSLKPEDLKDPWGNDYQYKYPGSQNASGYDVWSKGPDGTSGTSDDIGNW